MSDNMMQFHNGVFLGRAFVVALLPTITLYNNISLDVEVLGDANDPTVNLVEETTAHVEWAATLEDGTVYDVGRADFPIGISSTMLTLSEDYVEAAREDVDFAEVIKKSVRRLFAYNVELRNLKSGVGQVGAPEPEAGYIPGITDEAPPKLSEEEIGIKVEQRRHLLQKALKDAGITGKFDVYETAKKTKPADAKAPATRTLRAFLDFGELVTYLKSAELSYDEELLAAARKPPLV